MVNPLWERVSSNVLYGTIQILRKPFLGPPPQFFSTMPLVSKKVNFNICSLKNICDFTRYRHSSCFFGPGKNSVKGKPRYRRSILVLKSQNGEFDSSKSTFFQVFSSVKLQLIIAFIFFIK